MRRIAAIPILTCFAALAAGPVRAAEPTTEYWPLAKIHFPMKVAAINALNPKPTHVLFYSAPVDGKFELISRLKPEDFEKIVDVNDASLPPKYGFSYTVDRDRVVKDFAVQYEYADKTFNPPTNRLTPQYRVKFVTTIPYVRAKAVGASGVSWTIDDEDLDPKTIRLEGRTPGKTNWQVLNIADLREKDSYTWRGLQPDEAMEVRVTAKNKAGHKGPSNVVVLGGKAGDEPKLPRDDKKPRLGFDDDFGTPKKDRRTGTGFGGDDFPSSKTRIEYVNTNKLKVSSKITHITRSGVKAAQLFVQSEGGDWKPAGMQENLAFTSDTKDPTVEIGYEAPRDGLYGFIIQPISGAGTKSDDPRTNDPAQFLVFVDTAAPELAIKGVRVSGSGLDGPLIEIEWNATDKSDNLLAEPITLEYLGTDGKYHPIHGSKMIANSGKYTWEIADKTLWKFKIRATATDKAGNSTLKETADWTLVDLEKPSGTVEKVDKNGGPSIPKQVLGERPAGVEGGGVTPIGTGGRLPAPTLPPKPESKEKDPAPPKAIKTSGEIEAPAPPGVELPKLQTPPETKPELLPKLASMPPATEPAKPGNGGLEIPPLPPIDKK